MKKTPPQPEPLPLTNLSPKHGHSPTHSSARVLSRDRFRTPNQAAPANKNFSVPQSLSPKPPILEMPRRRRTENLSSRLATVTVDPEREAILEMELQIADEMDEFFLRLGNEGIVHAIEEFVKEKLNAGAVYFWREISSIEHLYSKTLNLAITYNSGLTGFAFYVRDLLIVPVARDHPAYDEVVDGEIVNPTTSLAFFPIHDYRNNMIGVVEVSKKANDAKVTDDNKHFIEFFQKKFRRFSKWLLAPPPNGGLSLEMMNLMEKKQFILLFQKTMAQYFDCRTSEIWRQDPTNHTLTRYCEDCTEVPCDHAGIVSEILYRDRLYNCLVNNMQSGYMPDVDGEEEESVLGLSMTDPIENVRYAIVIRGQKTQNIFTTDDEELLQRIGTLLLISFRNSLKLSDKVQVEISNSVITDTLLKTLPEPHERMRPCDLLESSMNALQNYTGADRVTYYQVDREHNQLKSSFQSGLNTKLMVPLGKGQCGVAAVRGMVLNTADAYDDNYFDRNYDELTGYKTLSSASVPIINTNGAVGAVVQILNKRDGTPFSQSDIGAAKIFGTICSCLLTNSLLQTNLNNTERRYDSLSAAVGRCGKLDAVISDAKDALQAELVTLYIFDQASLVMRPMASAGTAPFKIIDIPSVKGITHEVITSKEPFVTNNAMNHERLADEPESEQQHIRSMMIMPIVAMTSRKVTGMIRVVNKMGQFDEEDVHVTNVYCKLLAEHFDYGVWQTIAEHGKVEVKIDKWMSKTERGRFGVPELLKIPDDHVANLCGIGFDVFNCHNESMIQITFRAFEGSNLFTRLKVPNDTLFGFLYYLKRQYEAVEYHNWRHAIDMLQFAMFLLDKTKLCDVLTPCELLSLLVSVLGCYAKHDGTNNRYQRASNSPIGILFKENPMEQTSAFAVLEILEKDQANIFKNFKPEEQETCWKIIFRLILSVDSSDNEALIKKLNRKLSRAPLDMTNPDHRMLLVLLLFKASLLSTTTL